MSNTLLALRAISAVTARRILAPILWIAGIILIILYLGVVYLATEIDPWWALLLILIVPLTLATLAIGGGLWFMSGKLLPPGYDRTHKRDIVAFTDKIMRLLENSKTPYPIHLFLIAKDVLRGKESTHMRDVIDDSRSLKRDFDALRQKF